MKNVFFFLVMFGLLGKASAAEHYIVANIGSYHFDRDRHYEEVNLGLGYERVDGIAHMMAGAYQNSFDRGSAYLLIGATPLHGKVGGFVGLVSGYGKNPSAINPAAGLMFAHQGPRGGFNIFIVPPAHVDGRKVSGFLGLQLKLPLGGVHGKETTR